MLLFKIILMASILFAENVPGEKRYRVCVAFSRNVSFLISALGGTKFSNPTPGDFKKDFKCL